MPRLEAVQSDRCCGRYSILPHLVGRLQDFNGRGMPELAEATERALRLDLCMIFFSFAYLSFSVQFSCYFVQYVMLHRPAGSAGRVLLRGM